MDELKRDLLQAASILQQGDFVSRSTAIELFDGAFNRIEQLEKDNERLTKALEKFAAVDWQALAIDALRPNERVNNG